MSYCSSCGKEVMEGAKFCASCGSKVETSANAKTPQERQGNVVESKEHVKKNKLFKTNKATPYLATIFLIVLVLLLSFLNGLFNSDSAGGQEEKYEEYFLEGFIKPDYPCNDDLPTSSFTNCEEKHRTNTNAKCREECFMSCIRKGYKYEDAGMSYTSCTKNVLPAGYNGNCCCVCLLD